MSRKDILKLCELTGLSESTIKKYKRFNPVVYDVLHKALIRQDSDDKLKDQMFIDKLKEILG